MILTAISQFPTFALICLWRIFGFRSFSLVWLPLFLEVPRGMWHAQADLRTTVILRQLPRLSFPALQEQCPLLSKLHDSTSGFHCLMIPIPRECQCLQGCCPFHMPNVLLPHAAKCYIPRRNWENISNVTMSCFVSWWTYTIFPDSTSQCPLEKIAWRSVQWI